MYTKKKRTKKFQKENYDWKDEDKHIFDFAYVSLRTSVSKIVFWRQSQEILT